MKSTLPLLLLLAVFTSCTTAYKSGQTPDDVYYSPARPVSEYERTEDRDDRRYGYDDEAYRDDRYLRMKVRNRRYNTLFDDYYSYNPYYYHYYNGALSYNSPWNSYSYWNYYYNPYYIQPIASMPGRTVYSRPRTFDMNVYNPAPVSSSNPKNSRTYNSGNYGSRNSSGRNNSYSGGTLRDIFGSGNSSSSSSSSGSKSSSTPSSSSSSSSSGSSGSSNAPARRF